MKYGFSARLFPLMFDKYVYAFLEDNGIRSISKANIHKEYKKMVQRTPELPKDNPFLGNILIGCYVLSFYKASPELISEEIFHELIIVLCHSKPMVNGHKNEDAFDKKMLEQKKKDAAASQTSDQELDWKFTIDVKNNDSYDITYTKCGLCQLGRREHCFHLIPYLCEADYITYSLMGAELRRDHTLAKGDDYCDFQVSRKKV